MRFGKMKKSVNVLVVLALVFSLSINTYALDDQSSFVDGLKTVLDNTETVLETETVPDNSPDIPVGDNITSDENKPNLEEDNATTVPPVEEATPPEETLVPAVANIAVTNLDIKSVEVLNGGDVQILYRDEVYKGILANGEDPTKFYTTRREINLKDPRIFNVEFSVVAAQITDKDEYLKSVNFTYGNFPLDKWGDGKNLRGSTPIMSVTDKQIVLSGDNYVISASIQVDSPYGVSAANAASNIPYDNYGGGTQRDFGEGQRADNRNFFQFGPTHKGPGTYDLKAVAGDQTLASTGLHIGPYDEYHSWIEINEFCQDLIYALNGKRIDVNKKPLGIVAKGTLVKNAAGEYEEGDGVYVEVSILGYGLMDNYSGSNADFNNYSQHNAIWNVVVAKEEKTVDDYLKPGGFKDTANETPQVLIDKYQNATPGAIDFVTPFYQNNVHPDEVSGTDSMIHLIEELIEGGKSGKALSYKTFDTNQIDWTYRPSGNTNEGYTAFNHSVKPTEFSSDASRTEKELNTATILDNFIMVNTLCSNPDGKAAMNRVNRYGLDLNRDTVFATQPETIALTRDIAKWDPLVLLEWHGYVSQMLIEPCTAPHSLNFEPDLSQNNMIQLAYYGGKAVTGSTGYNRFHLPWDSMASGWDDGGNVYAPMFSMLFGTLGWTVEFPHSNMDAFEAGNAINYAMLNELLNGETAYYADNVLNGSIDGKDDHSVDNKYASLRKSTIMNKLEFKRRGVENIDSLEADKYFIDVVEGVEKYVGRVRKDDGKGGKLSFFPDYLIIPGTPETQFNVAEALRTLDFTMGYGAKVSESTEPVTYNGVTYPAGTYFYDMKQGRRNFIAEIMSKGYDATNFASMYADIYCNFPDTRGFDCVEVWEPDLFDGKALPVTTIEKKSDITGTPAEYIVFKSNSTDSVRFVNLLLSGRSSGPSTIDSKESVWMLRRSVDGVGTMSDYIIEAKNLDKIHSLVDNPDLGIKGCHIEGKYISSLPREAVKLVEPVISLNSKRTATAGGAIYWALDDYLGFASMKNEDGTDYNGNSISTVRPGANVTLVNGTTSVSGKLLEAIKNDKLGLIMIQSAASLTDANFGTGSAVPDRSPFHDVALYGNYNVDDSIFTANYAKTDTIYARGSYFTDNIPEGSKILFKSKDGDAFIGGYQNTSGDKEIFQGRTTMFSTILTGGGIAGKPVQSISFGANVFFRPHYQKYYPILATAIFAGAAGILDDQIDPVIDNFDATVSAAAISASDVDSGIQAYMLYQWNTEMKVYDLKETQLNGEFKLPSADGSYKIVVTDWAGNEAVKTFGAEINSGGGGGGGSSSPTIPAKADIEKSFGSNGSVTISGSELAKAESIKVKNANIIIELDKQAIEAAGRGANLEIKAVKASDKTIASLSDASKVKIGSRPIFQITFASGGKEVTNFSNGKVKISIPYKPAEGEKTAGLSLYYITEKGESERVLESKYDGKAGVVEGVTNHFSLYAVGYDELVAVEGRFKDIAPNSWYRTAIYDLYNRNILSGKTATTFEPETSITRAEFAMILAKASGADLDAYAKAYGTAEKAVYHDVAATDWYVGAVAWANETGVASGTGKSSFSPNADITRQDMAVMLSKYISNVEKKTLTMKNQAITFTDSAAIAEYAREAVSIMQTGGIISGSQNMGASSNGLGTYRFEPVARATRAEAASMISSLLKAL